MKVSMVMVTSLDGKTTKWHEPTISSWTSDEDKRHFFSLIENGEVIIMGSKTYEAAKGIIKPTPKLLRIILTKSPKKYLKDTVPGQLEFWNESPENTIKKLNTKKHSDVLLLGGSQLNASFLKEKLVTDILLTVEPKIFGDGNVLIGNAFLDIDLELIKLTKLNKKGTLLLRYKII